MAKAPRQASAASARPIKIIASRFFATEAGTEPVREWLKDDIAADDRKIIAADIRLVEYGWPIGMPTCKSLGDGLWEVRSSISDGRITRVIFYVEDDAMILLHGFIKKTERTTKADLALAKKRKKELAR